MLLLWILPCLLHLTVSWPVNEFFYLESQGGGLARTGSDSQLWQLDFETGCFRSKTSDKTCLTVTEQDEDESDLALRSETGDINQVWGYNDGSQLLESESGHVLAHYHVTSVRAERADGSDDQKWKMKDP